MTENRRTAATIFLITFLLSTSVLAQPSQPPVPPSAPSPRPPPAQKDTKPKATGAAEKFSVDSNDPNLQTPASQLTIFSGMIDPFAYEPRNRRDPFGQPPKYEPVAQGLMHGPLLPLQRFELNQLRLTAILWDVKKPKAMLRDPQGNVYIVTPNSKIGPRNGYVAAIREGEIVIIETIDEGGRLVSTAQVVRIAK